MGVLRGGPSDEYDVSLKTGGAVLNSLSPDRYAVRDIFIDRSGNWHVHGKPVKPHDALTHIDVAVNALHGHYGEDGKLQHILETHNIPFTGSGSFASTLAMNKRFSKDVYGRNGLKTPQAVFLESLEDVSTAAHNVFRKFPLPVVVKPVSGGSSIGVTLVKGFPELEAAITAAFAQGQAVFIEEFIKGVEATVGVIEHYRDQRHYVLPPVEIRPHQGGLFDYEAKYQGQSDEIVPGNFSDAEKRELERLAIAAHEALGLRHYSRSDFIIHPKRGIFILETNSLPGLTEESLMPKALRSVGASMSHFLDHIIQLAIDRK